MTTVERLLQHKGHTVWSIPPDASVFEAVQLMADKRVGALMVVDRNELIGVISERDYAREIVLKDRVSRDTPASAIMTRRLMYGFPQQTLRDRRAPDASSERPTLHGEGAGPVDGGI